MSTFYSVIQYTPDPAAGERFNIGLVVWDTEGVYCKFTNNWRRLRSVATDDIAYLHDFKSDFEKRIKACEVPKKTAEAGADRYETTLRPLIESWAHNVQFTKPRGSTTSALSALDGLTNVFITMAPCVYERGRTRSTAVALAIKALKEAVTERLSTEATKQYVSIKPVIDGALEKHRIDVAIQNGHLISGIHALSFEISEPGRLEKDIQSTAWIIEDIRKAHPGLPFSVFALPPNKLTARAYNRANRLFDAINVPLLNEQTLPKWAAQQADELAMHVG